MLGMGHTAAASRLWQASVRLLHQRSTSLAQPSILQGHTQTGLGTNPALTRSRAHSQSWRSECQTPRVLSRTSSRYPSWHLSTEASEPVRHSDLPSPRWFTHEFVPKRLWRSRDALGPPPSSLVPMSPVSNGALSAAARGRVADAGSFPNGKEFAFTILDDTDDATVENVQPIYELLFELGMRTTKTVWPVACPEGSQLYFAGETLADQEYLVFALELQRRGFELTWHCATMESSERSRTIAGLETFRAAFGHYPALHPNHGHNRENLYWGPKRFANPILRVMQGARTRRHNLVFNGDDATSPYFWGDLCRAHFRYVR